MKNLAKEALIPRILKWLPCGEHLPNSLSKDNQRIVVRWRPTSSYSVITEIYLDDNLLKKIETAIELENEILLDNYLEQIEDFIVFKAENFENDDRHVWQLKADNLLSVI